MPETIEGEATPGTALVVAVETVQLPALTEPVPTSQLFVAATAEKFLALIRADLAAQKFDATTEEGRDAIQKYKTKLVRSRTAVEAVRKEHTKGWRDLIDAANEVGKVWEKGFQAMEQVPAALLESYKQIERNRVAAHNAAIEALREQAVFNVVDPTAAEIQSRLSALPGLSNRDWQEFTQAASDAFAAGKAKLEAMLAAAAKREADARELEELRALRAQRDAEEAERLEREAAAKREAEAAAALEAAAAAAAEQARAQAEADAAAAVAAAEAARRRAEEDAAAAVAAAAAAAAALREAEAQAAREAQAAAEAARIAQEAAVAEAARKATEAAEKAAADALAAAHQQANAECARWETAAAISQECGGPPPRTPCPPDAARQKVVHNEAMAAFAAGGMSDKDARKAVTLIATGKIPHVTITYQG